MSEIALKEDMKQYQNKMLVISFDAKKSPSLLKFTQTYVNVYSNC